MTTLEERAPLAFHTPTERDELRRLLAEVEEKAKALADALAGIGATLARPPVDMLARPSYWPERMGYLDELRPGDRALFAGGWREVAHSKHFDGYVRVTWTDPDMDELVDKGTYAIRIQKRADEQELDALHRRDTGGL